MCFFFGKTGLLCVGNLSIIARLTDCLPNFSLRALLPRILEHSIPCVHLPEERVPFYEVLCFANLTRPRRHFPSVALRRDLVVASWSDMLFLAFHSFRFRYNFFVVGLVKSVTGSVNHHKAPGQRVVGGVWFGCHIQASGSASWAARASALRALASALALASSSFFF